MPKERALDTHLSLPPVGGVGPLEPAAIACFVGTLGPVCISTRRYSLGSILRQARFSFS
jgi:hypothetical protein